MSLLKTAIILKNLRKVRQHRKMQPTNSSFTYELSVQVSML